MTAGRIAVAAAAAKSPSVCRREIMTFPFFMVPSLFSAGRPVSDECHDDEIYNLYRQFYLRDSAFAEILRPGNRP
jgi:hypothetical protein